MMGYRENLVVQDTAQGRAVKARLLLLSVADSIRSFKYSRSD